MARRRAVPANDAAPVAPVAPVEELHPWWGRSADRVAFVTVYRLRGVTRHAAGVKMLVASCLPAAEVPDEAAIRARWGPGRYVVQPLAARNRLGGNPIVFDLPDDAGHTPGVEFGQVGQVEEEPPRESATLAAPGDAYSEILKGFQQLQNSWLTDALRQAREDRKQDAQLMVGIMGSLGGGGGAGGAFAAYLEGRVKSLEEENSRLREECRALREEKMRRELGDADVWATIARQAAPQLVPVIGKMVAAKLGGAPRAVAPVASAPVVPVASAPVAPVASAPVEVMLPSPEELDRLLASGQLSEELGRVLLDLGTAGNLPIQHAAVLQRHFA